MAQNYDIQWALSPNPSTVDFRNDTISLAPFNDFFMLNGTNACISDSAGELLFVTNGIKVFDNYGDTLFNGTGLSACLYSTINESNGLDIPQAALFIPRPSHSNEYMLFHISSYTLNRPKKLYYSIIDNQYGFGQVIEKNHKFYENFFTLFRDGGVTACKHANGRDYWIVYGGHNNNKYFKFLLTPDTLLGPFVQNIGPDYMGPYDNSYSKFSQSGAKYATSCFEGLITIMDFDRCSGIFSNVQTIFNNTSTDPINNPISGCASLEFSPNERYLYVANRTNLSQYDLLSSNIQDSIELYRADSSDFFQIDILQLGPNGRLYLSTWNGGSYYLHNIYNPDEKGDSCHFTYNALRTLTANSDNLPNMINYKLGPLIGSSCDTISTAITEEQIQNSLRIIPNPTNKYAYVEVGAQGNYQFQLLNLNGQVIDKKETRQVDIFDTEHLPGGMYILKVFNRLSGKEIANKKLEVIH